MILSAQSIRREKPVQPFCERTIHEGMTFGVGPAGYDIRIGQYTHIPPQGFALASSFEKFMMPAYLLGIVHDKSTWVRLGLTVQNTVIEPGWEGFLTLELCNHSRDDIVISHGRPIAQIVFHVLDEATDSPYNGKYQNQERGPQPARFD